METKERTKIMLITSEDELSALKKEKAQYEKELNESDDPDFKAEMLKELTGINQDIKEATKCVEFFKTELENNTQGTQPEETAPKQGEGFTQNEGEESITENNSID